MHVDTGAYNKSLYRHDLRSTLAMREYLGRVVNLKIFASLLHTPQRLIVSFYEDEMLKSSPEE